MNDTEQRNLIWRVVALTTSILVLLTTLVVVLCAILVPRVYGDFITALGFKNAGLVSYEYNYHKTNDINDLYYLNMKSILADNDKYIKKSYELLSSEADYFDFIEFVEQENINASISKMSMIFVSNEDDYLKGNYVQALYNLGEQGAFLYAYNDLKATVVTDIEARYNFVLGYYITIADSSDIQKNITEQVAVDIENYKNQLLNLYNSYDGVDEVEKYRLSVINYRIINILSSMKKINETLGYYELQELDDLARQLSEELLTLTR